MCWFDNSFNQSTVPPGNYIAISTGTVHTCAIRTNHSVVCFGCGGTYSMDAFRGYGTSNNFGQCAAPSGLFAQIKASATLSCALDAAGKTYCWGQRGYPPVPSALHPFPTDVFMQLALFRDDVTGGWS